MCVLSTVSLIGPLIWVMTQALVSSVTGEPSFTTLNCLDLAIWSLLKHTPPFSSHRSTTSPLSNPFHFSLLRCPMLSFHVRLLFAFQPVSHSVCSSRTTCINILQRPLCKRNGLKMPARKEYWKCVQSWWRKDIQHWLKRHCACASLIK